MKIKYSFLFGIMVFFFVLVYNRMWIYYLFMYEFENDLLFDKKVNCLFVLKVSENKNCFVSFLNV